MKIATRSLILGFALSASALLEPVQSRAQPRVAPTSAALFERAKTLFWAVEPRFNNYTNPIESLPPLAPNDPNVARYRLAAQAAERFLGSVPKHSSGDARRPVALYFAAMCYSSLGEHSKAMAFIDRLLTEFPNYRRPRLEGMPETARSVRPDLLHLKLYHQSQVVNASPLPPDPLAFLQSLAAQATETQAATPTVKTDESGLEFAFPTSDQLRAAALPPVSTLVIQIHNAFLPQALQKSGGRAVRDYLRAMQKGPFASYAIAKLLDIDRTVLTGVKADAEKALQEKRFDAAKAIYRQIMAEYEGTPAATEAAQGLRKATIGGYQWAAQQAFNAKNFDAAKASYQKIVAEFPDSPEAQAADAELRKMVPVAVKFYRTEGDKYFQPEGPNQFGVPQTKGREFYEKMYKEDPDGPQADYALFKWSEAMGTDWKTPQGIIGFKLFLEKFPKSPYRCRVMYLLGFFYGSDVIADDKNAIAWMERVTKEYPDSEEAPESLWHIAFYLLYREDRHSVAIPYLQKLKEKYPQSSRWRHVDTEIRYAREQIAQGLEKK